MKIQIVEDEDLQDKADYDEYDEVWLLSKRREDSELDDRLVVIEEITTSEQASSVKMPMLMTEIYNKHDNFEYEVLAHEKENFAIHAYVCDENCIKVVTEGAGNTDAEMTIQTGGSDDGTGGDTGNFDGDDKRDDEDGTRGA